MGTSKDPGRLTVKITINAVFWAGLIIAAASIFGSPGGLLAEYWYWWPTEAKAQVVNTLAFFGLSIVAIGGWAALNKPDRHGLVAALLMALLLSVGLGFSTVDCQYLFRCP